MFCAKTAMGEEMDDERYYCSVPVCDCANFDPFMVKSSIVGCGVTGSIDRSIVHPSDRGGAIDLIGNELYMPCLQ